MHFSINASMCPENVRVNRPQTSELRQFLDKKQREGYGANASWHFAGNEVDMSKLIRSSISSNLISLALAETKVLIHFVYYVPFHYC